LGHAILRRPVLARKAAAVGRGRSRSRHGGPLGERGVDGGDKARIAARQHRAPAFATRRLKPQRDRPELGMMKRHRRPRRTQRLAKVADLIDGRLLLG
jgi:hypothetical protein